MYNAAEVNTVAIQNVKESYRGGAWWLINETDLVPWLLSNVPLPRASKNET
jgi:hypothetical protein